MMHGIKKSKPQQSAYCVLEHNFLFTASEPRRAIPGIVVETVQLFCKRAMMLLVRGDHFIERGWPARWMEPQAAVIRTASGFAEVDATLLR
jgi:hypothetical protein